MAKDNRPEIAAIVRAIPLDSYPVLQRTTDRVEYIAQLMVQGRWRRMVTPYDLRKAWGVSSDVIAKLSAEASRVAKREVSQSELSLVYIEAINDLMRLRQEATEAGELAVAGGALKVIVENTVALMSRDVGPKLNQEQAVMARDLIAKGWTPPTLPGLPSPELEIVNGSTDQSTSESGPTSERGPDVEIEQRAGMERGQLPQPSGIPGGGPS